jgi:hypothetical protein
VERHKVSTNCNGAANIVDRSTLVRGNRVEWNLVTRWLPVPMGLFVDPAAAAGQHALSNTISIYMQFVPHITAADIAHHRRAKNSGLHQPQLTILTKPKAVALYHT